MKVAFTILGLAAAFFALGNAQQPAPVANRPALPQPDEPGFYLGPTSCAGSTCHGSPYPVENSNILMNEYDTWVHADGVTHVNAWNVLLNAKSRRIARNMNLPVSADRSPLCLRCHTLYAPEKSTAGVELSDGVSCESCHGPASGWRADHFREGWTHEDSLAAGMLDTRDPSARSTTCLGCHMGSGSNVVDHTLIAAGHPLLTFEVDNFTNSGRLPTHWRRGVHPERHGADAWAEGQLVAFRRSLQNLDYAARGILWPEFSHLACDSCHHQLRDGDWRQQRGYSRRPGLPQWNPEHWLPLQAVMAEVSPERTRAITADVERLSARVVRMSDSEAISSEARAIDYALAPESNPIRNLEWTDPRLRRVMLRLVSEEALVATADRRLAEQVVYGLTSLQAERVEARPSEASSQLTRRIDQLYALVDSSKYPDEIDRGRYLELTREIRALLQG
ncbi:MAG: cytochrome c family protein [Acidobacteria bacterium]|nr:cytochrome c family protein [Acidobacteriota bacterium]